MPVYCMYAYVCCMYGMYWPRQALNACVCVLFVSCMYLFVLYVFAPTSTDASTTSPKDPPLGRHPAGPTQSTPGQVADHFFRPSETHPRTRFGAPARAARVGGSKVHTTDLIYSEERQIYSEVFLARHVYRHMSEKLRTILECHSQHD